MPSTTSTTLTIAQLDLSRLNVRLNRDDATTVAAIEASILERGLIHPLNVHPLAGSKKRGVFAGGRRYRAIRNLVGRGDLPADWVVKVTLYEGYTDAQIIEMSWSENLLRRDLRRYEDCAAAARLVRLGETPAAIAHALGQSEKAMKGWARIGELAPEIFAAFEQGKPEGIDYEEAQAYAATADQALQRAAWEQMRASPEYQRTPARIRAALKVGDVQSQRRLRLVGADAYRDAGGRFELDLFSGDAEERGRIVDEGLLGQLADARLDIVRGQTRAATRTDLRFIAQAPKNQYGYSDETLRFSPRKKVGGGLEMPDGVVATIDVSDAGEPQVTYWWETRKAKHGTPAGKAEIKAGQPKPSGGSAIGRPYEHAAPAKAQAREEHGVSADGLYAARTVRREILRAIIVEDAEVGGSVGRSYATWAQLRALLTRERARPRAHRGAERTQHLDRCGRAPLRRALDDRARSRRRVPGFSPRARARPAARRRGAGGAAARALGRDARLRLCRAPDAGHLRARHQRKFGPRRMDADRGVPGAVPQGAAARDRGRLRRSGQPRKVGTRQGVRASRPARPGAAGRRSRRPPAQPRRRARLGPPAARVRADRRRAGAGRAGRSRPGQRRGPRAGGGGGVSSATIRADGLDWPIDAFLAARGFQRLAAWEWPPLPRDVQVETVSLAGELAPLRTAGDIRWADVLAYRVPRFRYRGERAPEPELAL